MMREIKKLGADGFEAIVPLDIEMNIGKKVCPEALAGWVDVCLLITDGNTVQDSILPTLIGLVDIGGRTTDIAVVTSRL